MECIQNELLPSLTQSLSVDYSVNVLDRSNPPNMIFRAGPAMKGARTGDVTTSLFSLRPPDLLRASAAAVPLIGGRRGIRNETFSFRVFRNFSGTPPFAPGVRVDLEPQPRHPQFILTVHGIGYRFVI